MPRKRQCPAATGATYLTEFRVKWHAESPEVAEERAGACSVLVSVTNEGDFAMAIALAQIEPLA